MLNRPKPSFTTFLRESPLHGAELEPERDATPTLEAGL
jgi:hypothetical protein